MMDEREELAALRRMAELEAKAGGAAPTVEAPPDIAVIKNAAYKGLAAVPDALLNAPSNIMNLVKAGSGMAMGAMGAPADSLPTITPAPNLVRRGFQAAGGIRAADEPVTEGQRLLDAGVQGGMGMALAPAQSGANLMRNLLVGGTSGVVGEGVTQATGSAPLGQAAGMLTAPVMAAGGQMASNRIAELQRQQQQNVVRDQTLRDAREAGYVFPPSQTSGGFINNRLESVAGKAALRQDATRRNQEVTTRLAAEDLPGFPARQPITEGTLEAYRNQQSAPYREVAALSPVAARTLQDLRDARAEATAQWRYYERSALPDAQRAAQAADARASMMDRTLNIIAQRQGAGDLMRRLAEARQNIAKSFDIERALNVGDANVAAPVIGRALDRGAPLSGNLAVIGRTQQAEATRPFMGPGATTPGVTAVEPYAVGMGLASGHPALAGLPLLRGPARSFVLSDFYQNAMHPNYNPGVLTRGLSALQAPPEQAALMGILSGLRQ